MAGKDLPKAYEGSNHIYAGINGCRAIEDTCQHNYPVLSKGVGLESNVSFGCGRKMRPHAGRFLRRQLKHEIAWKTLEISSDLFVEALC